MLHERRDESLAASAAYRKAIELSPEMAAAYNNEGRLLASRNELDGALEMVLEALRIDPSHLPALRNAAVLYRHAFGDSERAAYYERMERELTGARPQQDARANSDS